MQDRTSSTPSPRTLPETAPTPPSTASTRPARPPDGWPTFRLADLDKDNKIDILGHNTDSNLYLYLNTSNNGAMTFGKPSIFGKGWWTGEWTPYITDLNNDGTPEQAGVTRTGELYNYTPNSTLIVTA
ncbi:FG-GAP repeat domain-containing protein [Streptomyces avidinii]